MKTINVLRSIAVSVFAIVGVVASTLSLSLYASDNEVLLDQQGSRLW